MTMSRQLIHTLTRRMVCGQSVLSRTYCSMSTLRHTGGLRINAGASASILSQIKSRSFASEAAESGEKFEFKAETKKLMEIVAKSLYTDKEVFIRELISNAADACEKLRFLQATSQATEMSDEDVPFRVRLECKEDEKVVIIEDSGVGMTKDELVTNLGTIAKSGSLDFLNREDIQGSNNNIIGQFGVGFYSAFVVADSVEVFTKSFSEEKGWKWVSDGLGSFSVSPAEGVSRGTKIIIHLKDDCLQFSKMSNVKKIASKFSSFVDFPITINEAGEDTELNKQEALWLKSNATEEEHLSFFRFLNNSAYGEPLMTLTFSTDAPLSIRSVFYVPEDAPSRLFAQNPEIGVALHSRRVLIKKHADGVMPKWLFWVKGVVDCEDMPLNISRENMQDSVLMDKLLQAITRRFLRFLQQEAKKDEEKYMKFYKSYSYYLKSGLIEDKEKNSSKHRDELVKLLRFECSTRDKGVMISVDEYIEKEMKENQKNIYFYCAPDRETALASPFMEEFLQRNRSVLLLTEDIDEFIMSIAVDAFNEKKMVGIDSYDKDFELDLDPIDAPKSEDDENILSSEDKDELAAWLKEVLGSRVSEVKWTDRLVSSPAIVASQMTPQMRRMMKQLMQGQTMQSLPSTLELSNKHNNLLSILLHVKRTGNKDVANIAAEQLFDNASVAAGLMEEPRSMLTRLNKVLEMLVFQGAGYDYSTGKYRENEGPSSTLSEIKPEKKDKEEDNNEGPSNEKKEGEKEKPIPKDAPKFEEVPVSEVKA